MLVRFAVGTCTRSGLNDIIFYQQYNYEDRPSNFARNLAVELCDLGMVFTRYGCDVNIINAYGKPIPLSKQLARLDGLYFDIGNSVGDTERKQVAKSGLLWLMGLFSNRNLIFSNTNTLLVRWTSRCPLS